MRQRGGPAAACATISDTPTLPSSSPNPGRNGKEGGIKTTLYADRADIYADTLCLTRAVDRADILTHHTGRHRPIQSMKIA